MVHDRLLDADHMDRFKTLILPNIAALSDEQCRQLRAFVDRGGSLVATYETSLYDEWGARRDDFGLADLFGVSFAGSHRGADAERVPATSRTIPSTGRRHPILAGLDDAARIIHGTYRLDVTPRREFPHPPLTLIPSYPDLPMEKVYPRDAQTPMSPKCTCARSAAAASSTSPGTSTASSGRSWRVDHGILLAQCRPVGDRRGAAGPRSQARGCST